MKVFISFDMEGVAGIDGARMGGATEFVCNDSHGTMNNVDPEQLHGRAVYVAGRHKPLT